MDQGWRSFRLLILVVFLILLKNAVGFKGGRSNAHPRWGQPVDNSFSPRAVQSSLSEAPLTGKFPVEEVGSGVLSDRSQKSRSRLLNLRQYVKGGASSSYESASHTQTVPSGSVSASLAFPQDQHHAGSVTPLQLQGSSNSNVQDIASQLTSGQNIQNQFSSTSQGSSGPQSAGGFSQLVSLQGERSNSALYSPSISSQFTPDLHPKFSSSSLVSSSQATSDQSSPSLYMSSFPGGSNLLLEALGSASGLGGVDSFVDLSLQSQGASSQYAPATLGQLVSSPVGVSSQSASDKSTLGLYASNFQSSSAPQSTEVALPTYSQESLPSSPSIQAQGSTSQDRSRPELAGSSRQQSSTQALSGSYGSLSQSIASQYSPGSLTSSELSSKPLGLSSQPTQAQSLYMSSAPSRSGTPIATSSRYVPVQRESSSMDLSSPKTQGTSAQYAPVSPKYAPMFSPQAVSSQSGSNQASYRPVTQVGTPSQAGASGLFMGGSSYYSGSLPQSQGSFSQYAPASPTKYLSMSSPQGISSQSISAVSSQGSSDTLLGAASRFASQGLSSTYRGSVQSQGTTSQLASGSPTYSKLSSLPLVSSQSTSDRSSGRLTPTLQFGSQPQEVSRQFLSPQGASKYSSGSIPQSQGFLGQYAPASSKYAPVSSPQAVSSQSESNQALYRPVTQVGPLSQAVASSQFISSQGGTSDFSGSISQSQGFSGQNAPASPSKYVPLSSPQGLYSQSAPALSSRRGLTSFLGSSGSQSGPSFGSSSAYGGSYSQPQGTITQFASGSPSQYGSVSLSSPQDVASQYSQASQSVYSLSQSQKPQRWQPSASSLTQGIQASGAAASQGSYQSLSTQMPSRFSSSSSAVDSTSQTSPQVLSGASGQLVSTQGRSESYSGMSLQSPSTSNLYTFGSPASAKLGSARFGFSSQSTSDQSSSSLYGSSSQTRADAQPASSRYASLHGSSSFGSAPQSQNIASQYAPAPLSVDLKTPVSGLYSQASPSGSSLSLSQGSQTWQPSASSWTQGVQTSNTAALQSVPSSVQTSSRFSSPLPALSRPVDTLAPSGQMSTSASWRTQGLLGGVQRPSRLSFPQAAPGSTINSQTLQRPADSSLTPSSGLSARKSSVGMFSGLSLPQNAQTLSGYQSYSQESSTSVTGEYAPSQRFISNYEQSVVGQGASSSEDLRRSGSLFGQNVPVSSQPSRSSSRQFYSSVKG